MNKKCTFVIYIFRKILNRRVFRFLDLLFQKPNQTKRKKKQKTGSILWQLKIQRNIWNVYLFIINHQIIVEIGKLLYTKCRENSSKIWIHVKFIWTSMNQLDKELTQIERRICQNILKYRRIQCLESFNRIYGSMILFLYANAVESLM